MVSIKMLCMTLAKILNKKIRIKNKPLAKGGTKARCPDISKIKNLGFSKYTLLEEGLRKVVF